MTNLLGATPGRLSTSQCDCLAPSQGEDNYTWDFQEPANNPETTADEGDGFETTADEGDGFEYPSV